MHLLPGLILALCLLSPLVTWSINVLILVKSEVFRWEFAVIILPPTEKVRNPSPSPGETPTLGFQGWVSGTTPGSPRSFWSGSSGQLTAKQGFSPIRLTGIKPLRLIQWVEPTDLYSLPVPPTLR